MSHCIGEIITRRVICLYMFMFIHNYGYQFQYVRHVFVIYRIEPLLSVLYNPHDAEHGISAPTSIV